MKTEYKLLALNHLYGFMEGAISYIADGIIQSLKDQYNIIPESVKVSSTTPYVGLFDGEGGNCSYPVILLSMRIDGESWSIVRDCQRESDLLVLKLKEKDITNEFYIKNIYGTKADDEFDFADIEYEKIKNSLE